MKYGIYEVIGTRKYRGHDPGTRFEALLDRPAEMRALARGSIRLVERIEIEVPAGYTFPQGWLPKEEPVSTATGGEA